MTKNTTPGQLWARQKSEIDALKKIQAAERRVMNALGELAPDDARAVLARVAMAFVPAMAEADR